MRSYILIWSFLATEVKEQDLIENCSILRIKTQEQRQWHDSGVFIVHWDHISHFVLIAGSHSKWAATHLLFCKICSLKDYLDLTRMLKQLFLSCCKLLLKS